MPQIPITVTISPAGGGGGVVFSFSIPSLNGLYTSAIADVLRDLEEPIAKDGQLSYLGTQESTAKNFKQFIAAGEADDGGLLIVDFYGGGPKIGKVKFDEFAGLTEEFFTDPIAVTWHDVVVSPRQPKVYSEKILSSAKYHAGEINSGTIGALLFLILTLVGGLVLYKRHLRRVDTQHFMMTKG